MITLIEATNYYLSEDDASPKETADTLTLWHGGNLDDYDDVIAQKNGRYEYGPGLYLTTSYDVVEKYKKGGRKLYMITIEKGNDLGESMISYDICVEFVRKHVIKNKQKDIIATFDRRRKGDVVPANVVNVSILNNKALQANKTSELRQFFINNNIDYEIVGNAFGFGETMVVLYNMKKIVNIKQIKSTDKIDVYNLPTKFSN